ncbi:acetyl-CoA carboxylase carboxyl transferase subunit alpha/beta [bacterium]|nr:acetyl-CoA carboxylase carboxyl transferase subunit alpha/beta [bacterium]
MANHFYLPFERKGKVNYHQLDEYEKYQLSFHPERPKYLDYLKIFSEPEICFRSDDYGACLIQTHRAILEIEDEKIPVMLIGQQTGPTSDYKELTKAMRNNNDMRKWNDGMPTPASYERALKAIDAANKENRIIIIFVDTPGADPTEASEARGIAWRIGDTIHALAEATVPTISIIINRACSGGAIALTGCDITLAMEYSTYLVITPEACASILFHTRSRANEAASASRITSKAGYDLGIVDIIVPEPEGPAHRFKKQAIASLHSHLEKAITELQVIPRNKLFSNRVERWSKIGQWSETTNKEVNAIQRKVSRIPQSKSGGYLKRHKRCYDENGIHIYDPVRFDKLKNNGFVCDICGYRYTRLSIWDCMENLFDKDSFVEHTETKLIIDKDILGFPEYKEKLKSARKKTGLMTSMITGNAKIMGRDIVFCGADFGFFGASFCMSTGEKIWRAAEIAIKNKKPLILQAAGGGARMHEGCSSMVSIPKAHVALTRVEKAGLPVITIITDPTLGGVAIGYGSRGIRLFQKYAGNIGFSGRRVIEQYTGKKTSKDFQTTLWLKKHGHVEHVVTQGNVREEIYLLIKNR